MPPSTPAEFLCPITLAVMVEPVMCPYCSKNFEREALVRALGVTRRCPNCSGALRVTDLVLNRALKDLIHSPPAVELAHPVVGGVLVASNEPLCGIFLGKAGIGKSCTINTVAGRRVAESRASADGVTRVPSVVFEGPLEDCTVKLVDAPGLFDPQVTNEQTLLQVTTMLNDAVPGLDTIFHVLRMDRIEDYDREVPGLILSALSSSPEERENLCRRYRVIVTCCDSGDDAVDVAAGIMEFRGRLMEVFPPELCHAARGAIFIENNTRLRSLYNNPQQIRAQVLGCMKECRQNRALCYKPKLLEDILTDAQTRLQEAFTTCFSSSALFTMSHADVLALQRFFHYVGQSRRWQPVRPSDNLPAGFLGQWEGLPLVGRDRVAVALAERASTVIKDAAAAALEREFKKRQTPPPAPAPGWHRKQCSVM